MLPIRDTAERTSAVRSARSRGPEGLLTAWARALEPRARRSLFARLVSADVALAGTFPSYARADRVERVCFLLLCECAGRRGLDPGEFAMLSANPLGDAMHALSMVASQRRIRSRGRPDDR